MATQRDALLAALKRELLGPRDGPWETLPLAQDPRDEYVTGVLAPPRPQREIEADGDLDLPEPDIVEPESAEPGEEVEEEAGTVPAVESASPALDPRSLPSSMGLSFVVGSSPGARFKVLCTYARYRRSEHGWEREPHHHVTDWLSTDHQPLPIDVGPAIELRIRIRPSSNGHRVTLHLINAAGPSERYTTEELIFQPQLRVVLDEGTTLKPLSIPFPDAEAEGEGPFWRDRLTFARGHLCSAVWRDVDLERATETEAYSWIDAATVEPDLRQTFGRCDVRTEYLPTYEIRNPEMGWRGEDQPPEFSAENLSEAFSPATLRRSLEPLVSQYEAWIDTEEALANSMPPEVRQADLANLDLCRRTARRLSAALDLLETDEDARLAFCFANRAIALQASWQGINLEWRPFQLAFILLNLPGIVDAAHPDRDVCDLLYFPTGGGKTEAYLALMAFTIGYRRRLGARLSQEHRMVGTAVLSRYTLRLLTIQQFRRTIRLISACEYLRVMSNRTGGLGWLPRDAVVDGEVWGGARISLGLWVGGGVTPNNLLGFTARAQNRKIYRFLGALDLLKGARPGYDGPDPRVRALVQRAELIGSESEPAQLLNCPACDTLLAVPEPSLTAGTHRFHFPIRSTALTSPPPAPVLTAAGALTVTDSDLRPIPGSASAYKILTLTITVRDDQTVRARDIDEWFALMIQPLLGADGRLESARPSRMGYFIRSHPVPTGSEAEYDFAIYCPSPDCPLHVPWRERVPIVEDLISSGPASTPFAPVPAPFQIEGDPYSSARIPITALTVDEQVYSRVPTVVIATVDKFARLSDEPKAGTIFGNVDYYHARWGYYREGAPHWVGDAPSSYQAHPRDPRRGGGLRVSVEPLEPPALVIQDELHLIDGPLGSMVGAYEVVIDELCRVPGGKVKYIASTATVSRAREQIRSIFDRDLNVFPPPAPRATDNFFFRITEGHPAEGAHGRLYLGVAPIGRGAQTPIVRTWAGLLSAISQARSAGATDADCDPYWTLAGYFNAIRELAAGRALFRQDIPQRLGAARQLERDALELSGRTSSLGLPRVLDELNRTLPDTEVVDALVTTSMFGTGIDVPRLGLMIVHGQPKTTSAYIQATGRVGRRSSALVPAILRPSRPRDLDHYEFFIGFHRAIGRWVEPVTVAPFAPRTCEKVLGPVQTALLRQCRNVDGEPVPPEWRVEQRLTQGRYYSSAHLMATLRTSHLMRRIGELLERRAQAQPPSRRPPAGYVLATASNELDRWRMLAQLNDQPDGLLYREPAALRMPVRSVVLGDPPHQLLNLPQAFRDAPNSLRDVEGEFGVFVP